MGPLREGRRHRIVSEGERGAAGIPWRWHATGVEHGEVGQRRPVLAPWAANQNGLMTGCGRRVSAAGRRVTTRHRLLVSVRVLLAACFAARGA